MTPHGPTDERKLIYQEYRTAKRNLRKGRDFWDWMKIARGYDEARREAMHRAGTNTPQGTTYREEFTKIDHRERLIDRDEQGREFPSPEDRTFCIKVLENFDAPIFDPRRPSIKAWRDSLSDTERAKVNHPKRVWTAYVANTAPRVEQEAKRTEPVTKPTVTKPAEPDTKPAAQHSADAEIAKLAARIRELEDKLALARIGTGKIPENVAELVAHRRVWDEVRKAEAAARKAEKPKAAVAEGETLETLTEKLAQRDQQLKAAQTRVRNLKSELQSSYERKTIRMSKPLFRQIHKALHPDQAHSDPKEYRRLTGLAQEFNNFKIVYPDA